MKFIKYAVIATIVVVVLFIGALIAVTAFVDPNSFKGPIQEKVMAQTGRELAIEGDIEWGFWPKIRLKTGAVRLANRAGFGDEPFARFDEFEIAVATLPLIRSRIKMDAVKLYGGEINLARNADGVTNWSDLAQEGEDGPREEERSGGDLDDLPALALGGVDIKDAKFSYRDAVSGRSLTLSEITVATGPLELGDPVDLKITLNGDAKKPDLNGDAAFDARITYDLGDNHYVIEPMNFVSNLKGPRIPGGATKLTLTGQVDAAMGDGDLTVEGLRFTGLDTELNGSLSASNLDRDRPSARGKLTLTGKDLAMIFRILESPIADQLARTPDRSFDFNLDFDADMQRGVVTVPTLNLALLGTTVEGTLNADDADSDKPKVAGELNAGGPDLPALLALAGQVNGNEGLREMGQKLASRGDKSFSFATAFDADLKSGKVIVSTLSGKGLGLGLDGQLTAGNINSDRGPIDGNLIVTGRELGALLGAAGQEGLAEVVQSIDARAGVTGSTANISLKPLNVTATVAGPDIPNSPVDLTLAAGTANANLAAETVKIEQLELSGLGLNLTGNFDARDIKSDNPAVSGNLSVEPFDLRGFLTSLKQDLPPMADPKTLRKFSLATDFSGTTRAVEVKKLQVKLDETTLDGSLAVKDLAAQDIEFDLNVDTLNADRYLPPKDPNASRKAKKPVTPETAAAGAATEIPVEMLRDLKVKGDLKVGQLTVSGATLRKITVSVRARDGDVRVDPVSADLYEGRYKGAIAIDAAGDVPALDLNTELAGVKLRPLLMDVADKGLLGGTANIDARFTGRGATTEAIKQSLDGEAKLNVSEGTIRGLTGFSKLGQRIGGVGSLLSGDVAGAARSAGAGADSGGEKELYFSALSATVVANSGKLTNDDLKLEAPLVRATGSGTLADLKAETMDYTATATIVATLEGAGGKSLEDITGLPVPMLNQLRGVPITARIHGPIGQTKTEFDWDKLTAAMPDGKLKDAFATGSTVQKLKEKPEEVLKEKLFDKLIGDKKQAAPAAEPGADSGQTAEAPAPAPEKTEPKAPEDQVKDAAKDLLKGLFD